MGVPAPNRQTRGHMGRPYDHALSEKGATFKGK
jgi:hypothetical protein